MRLRPRASDPDGASGPGEEVGASRPALGEEVLALEDVHASRPAAVAGTRATRTIWVMALVAVLALGAGFGLSLLVVSPAQHAARTEPPEAGLVTVPVELRILSNDVVVRADALYDDPVALTLQGGGEDGGAAVATGAIPAVGDQLDAGSVALEVTGRPVIVLPGELPVFRTLQSGASGPDVVQLKEALGALGIDAGGGDTYDGAAAAGVRALFDRVGYPAPVAPDGAGELREAAREQVQLAEASLRSAETALAQATNGLSRSERLALDNAVNAAQRSADTAWAELQAARACQGPDCMPVAPLEAAHGNAVDDVTLAQVQREDGLRVDASAQRQERDAASAALEDARGALADADLAALTPLPASEVLYVGSLPRRVDAVAVQRGSILSGPALTVSGATLEIVASVAPADAGLLEEGAAAFLDVDGEQVAASVASIGGAAARGSGSGAPEVAGSDGESPAPTGDRVQVVLLPEDLSEEQRTALVGSNVRVRIPVGSTQGEVLSVPVAALTAGAGGETRIEVARGGASDAVELIVVETGLTAQGYVEIVHADSPLEAGDLVVVGR